MLLRYMKNVLVFAALLAVQSELPAAGVTLITHGFSGNVTDWIIPMAQKIPMYYRFPGTNFSCYEVYFIQDDRGNYVPTQSRVGGVPPTSAESGEIIVTHDWSLLACGVLSGAPYSTTNIAPRPCYPPTSFLNLLTGRWLNSRCT
jgi:hypothetical protein